MRRIGNSYIAALDVGTVKIACFIARIDHTGAIDVIGIGHQLSKGIKSGAITDIKLAESCIRSAVASAEQMAEHNIDKVIINISGSQQRSSILNVSIPTSSQQVNNKDIAKLIDFGFEAKQSNQRDIIHCIPIDYSLDGESGIKDPKGMFSKKLSASLHIIDASATTVFNMANCLAQCHLDVDGYIASSYASGLACLDDEEKELGSILIDFGGGNTSIAVFKGAKIIYSGSVPIGGMHVTNDIAHGTSTNIKTAERLKTLYGNLHLTAKDEQEIIDISESADDYDSETNHIPKALLHEIIKPRIEETLELVKSDLEKHKMLHNSSKIVITGGASQLAGLKDFCESYFKKKVRIGVPRNISGLAENTRGPAFATCAGILHFALRKKYHDYDDLSSRDILFIRPVARAIKWFKNNF